MQQMKASISFIEQCYRLYEQKMYYVAYRIIGDSGLAEDAVHEAFIKLMNSDVCFDDVCSEDCKRYIITVIRNSAINIYNRNKRDCEIIYLTDRNPDLHETSAYDNEDIHILEFINQLPAKYYEVVYCIAVREMSVKETALSLGISEVNVRKRYQRAKHKLKDMLNSTKIKQA